MRNGNYRNQGHLSAPTTPKLEIEAFDQLPPELREFLNYAPAKIATLEILTYYRDNNNTPITNILDYLKRQLSNWLSSDDAILDWPIPENYPCLPLSSTTDSPLSSATKTSRGSGARRVRAVRRSPQERKNLR